MLELCGERNHRLTFDQKISRYDINRDFLLVTLLGPCAGTHKRKSIVPSSC